jgi:hypothetical protein
MKKYCIININGLKSKPMCKTHITLNKYESDSGYRITKSTLGINIDNQNRKCIVLNNYQFDRYNIIFNWLLFIKPDNNKDIISGNMFIEIKLEDIHLLDNGKIINSYLPCNTIEKIVKNINNELPYLLSNIKYIENDLIKMLFPKKYHTIFEYLVGLIFHKSINFKTSGKKIMNPCDIFIKIDIL